MCHRSTASATDFEKEAQNLDSLALGSNTKVVKAPQQWLVVMGPKASGKSTLIRQLKAAHEAGIQAMGLVPTLTAKLSKLKTKARLRPPAHQRQ